MKRLLLTAVLGTILSVTTYSAPITPAQALSRITTSSNHTRSIDSKVADYSLASTPEQTAQSWYAFNCVQGGWIILSADDEAMPLLGYSDTGSFDYEKIPDAMKWWLSQYADEIKSLRNGSISLDSDTYAMAPTERKAISPMLTTAWDQNAPFNLFTPEIDGAHTPSGCVATALAQFMKYYNYPEKGTGALSYVMNGSNLSMDLDTLTFNWKEMIDVYRDNATETQKIAVAKLMQACGYAVESTYEKSATSASVYLWLKSLVQNFGYAPSSRLVSRVYMNNVEWDNTIYKALAEGGPVLYSGMGSSGGHAFVCDGYADNGFYHFNWGWSGLSNGYFLLSALNPTALGTGGGAGGFNIGQIAIVDCRPNFEGSKLLPQMGFYGTTQISYSNLSKNLSIIGGGLLNLSAVQVSARPGFEIECPDGKFIYAGETNAPLDFPVIFILSTYARKIPVTLTDGTYKVRPVFGIQDGDSIVWHRVHVPISQSPYWTLTIADGKGTIEENNINSDIEITDFKPTTGIYASTQFKIGATIENKGTREFMDDIYVVVYRKDGDQIMVSTANPVDLMPGEKDKFEFTVVPRGAFSPGELLMSLALDENGDGKDFKDITSRISVNVLPFQPDVEMEASKFFIENAESVNPENIKLNVTMTCVKGNYAYPIRFWIRPSSVTSGSWGQMIQSDYIYMNQGDTTSFVYTFEYPKGEPGVTYKLLSNYVIPQSQAWLGSCEFTISPLSGVESPEEDNNETVRYFNLQGVEIAHPTKGFYIRIKGGKSEKVVF